MMTAPTSDGNAFHTTEHAGRHIVEGVADTVIVTRAQDATRVMEACFSAHTRLALLHAGHLAPAFFDLSSGQAGEILDKLRRFRLCLAVVCPPGVTQFSSRFAEILCDDLQVFESRDRALDWLATRA